MAQLIVEVQTRTGGHVAYHKVENFPVSIGRALDNDIILPDPAISQKHLIIEQGVDGWVAIDQASANGTILHRTGPLRGPTEITSGAQLLLGKTVIRVLSPAHAVGDAQRIDPLPVPRNSIAVPLLSIASIVVSGAILVLNQFLNTAEKIKPVTLLAESLPLLFFPFLWAGIWAAAGFVVRRRGLFGVHLIIANAAFVVVLAITVLYEYLDYFSGNVKIAGLFQYASMAALSSLVLFASIKTVTGAGRARQLALSMIIGIGIIGAVAITDHAESFENNIRPDYSQTLKPPYAMRTGSVSLDEFVAESTKLFKKKDKTPTDTVQK